MATATLLAVGIYCLIAAAGSIVILRTRWGVGHARPMAQPSVVVVVAARNEELCIAACLAALQVQEDPPPRLRFVVVDDRSTDATLGIAQSFAANDARFLVTSVPVGQAGKAAALAHGIDSAPGDIIVTTDADCVPARRWLRGVVNLLHETNCDVLCGPTVPMGTSLGERVQQIDWLLLFGLAGGFSAIGLPITAMGNNMAMRRESYEAVGSYRRFTDTVTEDYALFRAISETDSGRARLVILPEVVNRTKPENSLLDAFRQRRRWARGGLDARWWVRLLYATVWSAHVIVLVSIILAWSTAILAAAGLVAADTLLLAAVRRRTGERVPWSAMAAFEVFKLTYVSAMPLSLLLRPRVTWKGQEF